MCPEGQVLVLLPFVSCLFIFRRSVCFVGDRIGRNKRRVRSCRGNDTRSSRVGPTRLSSTRGDIQGRVVVGVVHHVAVFSPGGLFLLCGIRSSGEFAEGMFALIDYLVLVLFLLVQILGILVLFRYRDPLLSVRTIIIVITLLILVLVVLLWRRKEGVVVRCSVNSTSSVLLDLPPWIAVVLVLPLWFESCFVCCRMLHVGPRNSAGTRDLWSC